MRQLRRAFPQALATIVLVAAVGLASCGSPPSPSTSDFKVALLSPGPVSDAGWNAAAYEGLLRIRDELGAEISQVEVHTPAEFEQGFRDYASRGFDLVFGHGFEFQDAAASVSPDFPDTVFITSSGTTVRDNVAPIVFEIEEATYLMGVLAAEMSKSGRAGCVGGVEIPSVKSSFIAFDAGARAERSDFVVVQSFIGNWEDVGAAKEATLALIARGADFILHNADAAGLGVFQAVSESSGVYAFGTNKNQNQIAPKVILASAVLDIPEAFVSIARSVKEGSFRPHVMRMGMEQRVVSLELNPELEPAIPAEALRRIEEVRQGILSGEIDVPRGF